jgi:hypothetical protein
MRRLKRQGMVFLLMLFSVAALNADMVCTFLGEGEDVIHEVAVKYKSSVRITFSGNELIKKVVYNRKFFRVDSNLHEAVVRPKGDGLAGYIAVITEEFRIYIFRLKAIKAEERSKFFDRNIIINS